MSRRRRRGSRGAQIVTSGLLAEWRFDDGAGQVLTDYSGNAKHGKLGTTTGVDADDPTWVAAGLSFDGGDRVVLPTGLMTGNHAISWFAVVTARSGSGAEFIGCGGFQGTATAFTLNFASSTHLPTTSVYGSAAAATAASGPTLPASLGGAYDPGAGSPIATLYVNGALSAGPVAQTQTLNIAAGGGFTLGGGNSTGLFLTGTIAFVALFNTTLTPTQMSQMHAYARALLAPRGVVLP